MIKYLLVIGLAVLSLPFWLPTSLGGHTAYHFVLTDSMKPTLDPGSFVVLRRDDTYEVGEAVAYLYDTAAGDQITILHRIIGREPDGRYIMKGDAVETTELVEEEAITGKLVAAIPVVGFLPGALRQTPIMVGGLLLTTLFMASGLKKKKKDEADEEPLPTEEKKRENLFIPAALILMMAFPFANMAVADFLPLGNPAVAAMLEQVPLIMLLVGVLVVTRLGEAMWAAPEDSSLSALVEINYAAVMMISITLMPLPQILESARSVLTL